MSDRGQTKGKSQIPIDRLQNQNKIELIDSARSRREQISLSGNLVSRALRVLGQRALTGRDPGLMEKYYCFAI